MTHTELGHSGLPSTSPSRASVEKSGYASPDSTEYTVDRDTPAVSAITLSGRGSASSASESARATAWAALAAPGASDVRLPVGKGPEGNQVFGAGALRRTTPPTLPHASPLEEGDPLGLQSVRINGHNGSVMPPSSTPAENSSATRAAAALTELRQVTVPASRAVHFATRLTDPARGQRRQAYLTLELLPRLIDAPDRLGSIREVMGFRKVRRFDYGPVQANLVDVLAHLPAQTQLRADALTDALASLSQEEQLMQPANNAPRVLVGIDEFAFFVETHPARKAGGTEDPWMNRRLAAHFVVGSHLPNFAGVLVFTVRAMQALHVATLEDRHLIGACGFCRVVAS